MLIWVLNGTEDSKEFIGAIVSGTLKINELDKYI